MKKTFVKMDVDVARSGMVADMGPELWTTLCILASHMDAKGECFPLQYTVARQLNVSRQTANKYIGQLLDYRWEGKPVLTLSKTRRKGGRFYGNTYTVLPTSGFSMGHRSM